MDLSPNVTGAILELTAEAGSVLVPVTLTALGAPLILRSLQKRFGVPFDNKYRTITMVSGSVMSGVAFFMFAERFLLVALVIYVLVQSVVAFLVYGQSVKKTLVTAALFGGYTSLVWAGLYFVYETVETMLWISIAGLFY